MTDETVTADETDENPDQDLSEMEELRYLFDQLAWHIEFDCPDLHLTALSLEPSTNEEWIWAARITQSVIPVVLTVAPCGTPARSSCILAASATAAVWCWLRSGRSSLSLVQQPEAVSRWQPTDADPGMWSTVLTWALAVADTLRPANLAATPGLLDRPARSHPITRRSI